MYDIENKADIQLFVDAFYEAVRNDELIGPVFENQIEAGNWPIHLERMYRFWNTVLFGKQDYRGNPFSKHRQLPIQEKHFERWLSLLNQTLDENFKGSKAEEVKSRAYKMGQLFQAKLAHIQNDSEYRSIV